ncbi:hypothetical protein N801_14995 [Knoellia aerolata DSM 18566]|uniref:AB hydrolase-1 domain-containing protein n=1 Tax=Knoellia aerolata DSM 18566 TaxID=1385519 RepID=A0A0A0JSY5_9MICO|nr:hypothetical protein N801_14995 [Knoellia aerolata DSM 18566]
MTEVPAPIALLALPGLGLGPESWRPTLGYLTGGGTAYVRVSPGYGEPAPDGQDLSPRALAAGILARVPATAPRFLVLGHSAGSQVAAHVAALDPSRVAGLVLVGPSTDVRAATWPRLVKRWLPTSWREPKRQVPTLVRQYARSTLPAMVRSIEAARQDSILETLRPVTVPVLVIRGPHDHISPADWAVAVAAEGGPGSRAVTLSAGAHMVPFTHGRLVAAAVSDFLSDLDALT